MLNKFLLYIGVFFLGVLIGWLNPIEGPLDWTYDEYASQPAHRKHSGVAAPANKVKKEVLDIPEEEELSTFPFTLINLFTNREDE